MIDRSHTEALLDRVAFAAITYYPSKAATEPGYNIDEDVTHCIAPLRHADDAMLRELRDLIAHTISDPTEHRQRLIWRIEELTETQPRGGAS